VISGFCHSANEEFTLLGCQAVQEDCLTLDDGTDRSSQNIGN